GQRATSFLCRGAPQDRDANVVSAHIHVLDHPIAPAPLVLDNRLDVFSSHVGHRRSRSSLGQDDSRRRAHDENETDTTEDQLPHLSSPYGISVHESYPTPNVA